jgi:uncharacterized protein (DUF1330 family)
MTTYLINHMRLPNDVHNLPTLEYMERVEGTFTPFGGKWLVLDAPVEVLEGHWPGNAVMMEFPDREMARRWYGSPGYREIIDLRTGNAISDMVLIDSVGPDFTSGEWARRMREHLGGGEGGAAGAPRPA